MTPITKRLQWPMPECFVFPVMWDDVICDRGSGDPLLLLAYRTKRIVTELLSAYVLPACCAVPSTACRHSTAFIGSNLVQRRQRGWQERTNHLPSPWHPTRRWESTLRAPALATCAAASLSKVISHCENAHGVEAHAGGLVKNDSAIKKLNSLHTGEVVGSIPTAPTSESPIILRNSAWPQKY
jgi:hypothetical protein